MRSEATARLLVVVGLLIASLSVTAQTRTYTIDFDREGHGLEAFGSSSPVRFFVMSDAGIGPLLEVSIRQLNGGEGDYRVLNPNDPAGHRFPDNDFQGNYLQQLAGRPQSRFLIVFGEVVDAIDFAFGVHADPSIPSEQKLLSYTTTLGGVVSEERRVPTRTSGGDGNSSGRDGVTRKLDCIEGGPDIVPPQPTDFSVGLDNIQVTIVPEPGAWASVLSGISLIALATRRRQIR